MICVTIVSFSIMINGSTSTFFKPGRASRHGCSLSPLLFLIVVKGPIMALTKAKRTRDSKGILIGRIVLLSRLLFVDGIPNFVVVPKIYYIFLAVNEEDIELFSHMFPYRKIDPKNGLKYMGFHIKPNGYGKKDWN
jgi:hypothetical protein